MKNLPLFACLVSGLAGFNSAAFAENVVRTATVNLKIEYRPYPGENVNFDSSLCPKTISMPIEEVSNSTEYKTLGSIGSYCLVLVNGVPLRINYSYAILDNNTTSEMPQGSKRFVAGIKVTQPNDVVSPSSSAVDTLPQTEVASFPIYFSLPRMDTTGKSYQFKFVMTLLDPAPSVK